MTLVTVAPGHQLAPAPAESYARMLAAGCWPGITSSWRSTALQAELRADYLAGRGAFALPPGFSKHETGEALDLKWFAAVWVRAHPEHGWRFTNDDEWWHVEYVLALDLARLRLTPPTRQETDDMALTPAQENKIDHLIAMVGEVPWRTALAVHNQQVSRVEGAPTTFLQDQTDGVTAALATRQAVQQILAKG